MPYRPSPNLASKVKISRLVRHSHTSTSQTVRHRPAVPREPVDLTVTDAASRSSEQRLAIASLPTFASAGQYFVVVAPDAEHVDTGASCNSLTYRRRAWCRAEIFSCSVPDFQPGTNAQRRGFAHHHHCHSSVASKRSLARSLSLGSTNRSSPARPSRALADAPPPARPHISWALPEHKSYLQTSQTHVAVVQRISLPPPDDSIHRLSHDP